MNWLLVVIIANTPMQTNLVYSSLSECMTAESRMRSSYVDMLNVVLKDASMTEQSKKFAMQQTGWGACIPTK